MKKLILHFISLLLVLPCVAQKQKMVNGALLKLGNLPSYIYFFPGEYTELDSLLAHPTASYQISNWEITNEIFDEIYERRPVKAINAIAIKGEIRPDTLSDTLYFLPVKLTSPYLNTDSVGVGKLPIEFLYSGKYYELPQFQNLHFAYSDIQCLRLQEQKKLKKRIMQVPRHYRKGMWNRSAE